MLGAPYYNGTAPDTGIAFLYLGSDTGPDIDPDWQVEGEQEDEYFGYAVSSAGDVNQDNAADILIGAPGHKASEDNEGAVYLFHGAASGLSLTANWTTASGQGDAQLGHAVGSAGDVNDDGIDDIVIGAPYFDAGGVDNGQISVYYGSASGINSSNLLTISGSLDNAHYGFAVNSAGDVNGDGIDDLIIGAPGYDNGAAGTGQAYLYYGATGGLLTAPAWTTQSNAPGVLFGWATTTAGDVNGDGYADIMVAAPIDEEDTVNNGRQQLLVYYGAANGPRSTADWIMESDAARRAYVVSMAGGDINGDGIDDVLIGLPFYERTGLVVSYYGSVNGLSTIADWSGESDQEGALMGSSVAGAGDVNGDGIDDILVSAPAYDTGQIDAGRVYLHYGSINGVSIVADWTADGDQAEAFFGQTVNTADDINGDGYDDILIGAPAYDNGAIQDAGRAYLYAGSAGGLAAAPLWQMDGTQDGELLGTAVSTVGDLNNDGYDDIAVTAPLHDADKRKQGLVSIFYGSSTGLNAAADWTFSSDKRGGRAGIAVASAGDINGDGYDDLMIGARKTSAGTGGVALVFHGSPTGLNGVTPNWTAVGTNGSRFGHALDTAGDINGDGYDDVLIGAYRHSNNFTREGAVYLYLGSNSGLNSSAAWSVEGGQKGVWLGRSVSGAGDMNGDGYDDILIGSPGYQNGERKEGRAYIYHGSAAGVEPEAAGIVENNKRSSRLGYAVDTVGDANGDGFDDIIIGAPQYDHGEKNEGGVYLFYGSGSGVTPPTAVFNAAPLTGSVPLTVTFSNSSANAASYIWDFGDGISSTLASPVHVYTETAVYTVSLTASGPGGTDTITRTNYISVTTPVQAAFTATPLSGTVPLTVSFINTSVGATTYQWQFGDGGQSIITNPTHTYTTSGIYDVSLTAFGSNGNDVYTQTNYITVTTSSTIRTWHSITTTITPAATGEYALAYNNTQDVTILYGGNATGWPYENGTWAFDGNDWTVITSTTQHPNAVYGMGMVYDGSRIVLFGGSDTTDSALAETWSFNGSDWTQLSPAASPPRRTNHTIVYDPVSGDIYLFGGNDGNTYFNDFWRFDGSNWNPITVNGTLPVARTLHGMAYDSDNDTILIVGGRSDNGILLSDSWSFNATSNTWSDTTASGPTARQAMGVVYDPVTSSLILIGGSIDTGDTILNDAWQFQTGYWSIAESIPITSGTAYHTLVYDSVGDAILLFINGETWEYR